MRALAPTNRSVSRKRRAISASLSIANQSLQSKFYPSIMCIARSSGLSIWEAISKAWGSR